jgi:hypothetical protein
MCNIKHIREGCVCWNINQEDEKGEGEVEEGEREREQFRWRGNKPTAPSP